MKRYEQMEQRRFEQQVAPNIDQAAPAPVRGPVRIEPPRYQYPELQVIQDALQNGARLAVQLAGYAKKAQDEADELAQIDFDGWVKSETIRRSADFAKLPTAEQEAQSAAFRDSFVADAKAYAATLDFSSRRRQVVDRMIPAHADQFGARLYAESIRQMERNNCEKSVNLFKAAMDNADVDATGTNYDRLIAKGIDPGMTRDQAISRTAYNKLNGRLPQLNSGELARQLRAADEFLAEDRSVYDLGDGVKLTRKDLQRFRDNADRVLADRERKETYAFLARVEDGTNELTIEDLKRMHDEGRGSLSDRQFVQWTRVLKERNAKSEKSATAAAAAAAKNAREASAALLKRSAENTVFSRNINIRNQQLREFEDRAFELFGDDIKLFTEKMAQIQKIAEEDASGKSAWSSTIGRMTKQYLAEMMKDDKIAEEDASGKSAWSSTIGRMTKQYFAEMKKDDPYIHTQKGLKDNPEYGKPFAELPPELQERIAIRQDALVDTVKDMLASGKYSYADIKKVIDAERNSINSEVVSAYLKNPGRRMVRRKLKDGSVWIFDARTRKPIGQVRVSK